MTEDGGHVPAPTGQNTTAQGSALGPRTENVPALAPREAFPSSSPQVTGQVTDPVTAPVTGQVAGEVTGEVTMHSMTTGRRSKAGSNGFTA